MFLVWAALGLPESPRFLALTGRHDAAASVLSRLRPATDDASAELAAIVDEGCEPRPKVGWGELAVRQHRRAVVVAMGVLTLQVATGIDFVTVFAPRIFLALLPANSTHPGGGSGGSGAFGVGVGGGSGGGGGVDVGAGWSVGASNHSGVPASGHTASQRELLQTIYVGVTFLLATPFAVALIDRCGRRRLLLAGSVGMSLSLAGLAVGFNALASTPDDDAAGLSASADPSASGAVSAASVCVACVLLYVACFAFSWGCALRPYKPPISPQSAPNQPPISPQCKPPM